MRDRALALTFPPETGVTDAYLAAFRPSDLLFQVLIMSALSTVVVPQLARYRAESDTRSVGEFLSSVIGVGSIVFGVLALVMAAFFRSIAPLLVQFQGETLELYIQFGRIALLTNFLMITGNAMGQFLITTQRYWIYGLTPILYTLGTIGGTLLLSKSMGPLGPMVGTLIGTVLYVGLRFYRVIIANVPISPRLWHVDLSEIGILMIPRMLALGALQVQLLFFDAIASGFDAGAITINAYARNFQSVVVGIAGIAVAQSAYPLMSEAIAKKESNRFWIYVRKAVVLLLIVTILGAIALSLSSPIAARLVGLTPVLAIFTPMLLLYSISIPFESINHLLLRAFYATKNTLQPALMTCTGGVVAIAITWYLSQSIGVWSLALGFSAGQIVQLIGLSVLLKRRVV